MVQVDSIASSSSPHLFNAFTLRVASSSLQAAVDHSVLQVVGKAPSWIMASSPDIEVLLQWLKVHGGYLHPSVSVAHNRDCGVHVRAREALESGTRFCTVPHSLALSSLNASVDDTFSVFKQNQGQLGPEGVGYFYLMYQHIHRAQSFWKPYLDTLPQPEDEHLTPFWFDEQDLTWLKDTDVLHTTIARRALNEDYFRGGLAILERAGVDCSPYTWHLFRWAVTMFTSRSFSSRTLHPQDSKYWTAYKAGPDGRRQTVLLDLSRSPAADLDFPVLFPVADAANHRPNARAEWTLDPGRFSITIEEPAPAGSEICNNYGPKANAELLLGYGFCIPDNPHDSVLLTLKPPPEDLQADLQRVHPGYYTSDRNWSGERATFVLRLNMSDSSGPSGIFEEIPQPLLELMLYILRHERGLAFDFVENPLEYLTSASSSGRRYLPHIARMIVQSLAPKLANLHASTPTGKPINQRQMQAKIYRDGQISILKSVIEALRGFTRSLLRSDSFDERRSLLVTLDDLLQILAIRGGENEAHEFLVGIAVSAGTTDIDQLRQAGWEDDVLVLLLCYSYLQSNRAGGGDHWFSKMLPEYLGSSNIMTTESELGPETPIISNTEGETMEQANSLLQIVWAAREVSPGSIWGSPQWNTPFIANFGGRFIQHDSFLMMVPIRISGEQTREEIRPVVYLHESVNT